MLDILIYLLKILNEIQCLFKIQFLSLNRNLFNQFNNIPFNEACMMSEVLTFVSVDYIFFSNSL